MKKNLQSPQVLLSAHAMNSAVLPALKVGLTGFWEVWASTTCLRTVKIPWFILFGLCVNDHCMCNFDDSFYLISNLNVEFLFSTNLICPPSIKFYDNWTMVAKSNTPKTSNFESCPYPIKLHFQWWEIFSLKVHIKRFILKSPTTLSSQIFKNVGKSQLLGGYTVVTPSCHLALVWSNVN
jgi:hypothetical protein